MQKKNGAAAKVPKHFATVPLEIVKEIAVEDVPMDRQFGVAVKHAGRSAKKNLLMPTPTRAPAGKKR